MNLRCYIIATVILAGICIIVRSISQKKHHDITKKRVSKYIILSLLAITILVAIAILRNSWRAWLYTPTQIVKVADYYMIEDCWNGRIVYSNKLQQPAFMDTVTENIKGGHTIASDGEYFLLDDSENNQVLLYKINEPTKLLQIVKVDGRPHFILYNEGRFFILSSFGACIYEAIISNGKLQIINCHIIDENINYARSISIMGGCLYLPTSDGAIYKVDLSSWDILEVYNLPIDIGGMNYIEKIENYYYLTIYSGSNFDMSYPPKIIRVKDLRDLSEGNYQDITNLFDIKGVPYFISCFDNKYYLTEIDTNQGIYEFEVQGDNIFNVQVIYRKKGVPLPCKLRKKKVFER